MLPPAARLRRRVDFVATTRGGRRAARGCLVVHLNTDPASGSRPRAGFAVSKAVGTAPVRNKVRRRLRDLVRQRLEALPTGSCLVVRALPAASRAGYAELGADLDAALSAARRPPRGGRVRPGGGKPAGAAVPGRASKKDGASKKGGKP